MDVFIKAIEYYLPECVITNEQLVSEFPEWDADKVTQKTGIIERHMVSNDETATDLAYNAALNLFEHNPDVKDTVYTKCGLQVAYFCMCSSEPIGIIHIYWGF